MSRRWLLFFVLIAACSAPLAAQVPVDPTATATFGSTPDATATFSDAAESLEVGSDPPYPTTATITDVAGDLHDGYDAPAATPSYTDLRSLTLSVSGADLLINVTVKAPIPMPNSTLIEAITWVVYIGTDGVDVLDFWVAAQNREDGTYEALLDDWDLNRHYDGRQFPGSLVVEGNTLTLSVPLSALGSPQTVWASALTQATPPGSGGLLIEDELPDGNDPSGWVVIRTGP